MHTPIARLFPTLVVAVGLGLTPAAGAQTARPFVRGDVDGDGYADLVAARIDAVLLYRGGAGGVAARPEAIAVYPVRNVRRMPFLVAVDAIEDLDGDGRAEVVTVAHESQPGDATVTIHVAVRAGPTLQRTLWEGAEVVPATALLGTAGPVRAAGDLDRDGHADMVAAGVALLARPLRAVRVASVLPRGALARGPRVVFPLGDVDGDGAPELWVAPVRREHAPNFYPLAGAGGRDGVALSMVRGAWRARPMPLFPEVAGSARLVDVRAADVTGDGAPELLGVGVVPAMAINAHVPARASLRVAARPGEASVTVLSTELAGLGMRGDLLACVADVDGDRIPEVLTAAGDGHVQSASLRRWDLSRRLAAPTSRAVALPAGLQGVDCSRDVDGDGRVDLVGFSPTRVDGSGPDARSLRW